MSAITIATRSSRSKRSTAVAIACSRIVVTATTATTAVGPSARRSYAARSASRSRPSTVTASQPNAASLPAMSPSSTVLERLSTTISVRLSRARGAGVQDRLPVRALVQLGVARQDEHALLVDAARAERVRDADRHRQPVAERAGRRLDAGHAVAVRVAAEDPVPRHEPLELLGGEEAVLRRARRRTRAARALREDEAVASLPRRIARVEAHHVVEDVDHLERRDELASCFSSPRARAIRSISIPYIRER